MFSVQIYENKIQSKTSTNEHIKELMQTIVTENLLSSQ